MAGGKKKREAEAKQLTVGQDDRNLSFGERVERAIDARLTLLERGVESIRVDARRSCVC